MGRNKVPRWLIANLLFVSAAFASPFYRLEFEGPAGDFISLGNHVLLTESIIPVTTAGAYADLTGDGQIDRVWFSSSGGSGPLLFALYFDSNMIPGNLVPGHYPDAQRSPFAAFGHPGFWLAWDHRGCNQITGEFTIHEAVFGPSGPTRFSAEFVQSCEGFMPPLHGTFEFSLDPLPPPSPVIPEPSTVLLVGAGLVSLARWRKARWGGCSIAPGGICC